LKQKRKKGRVCWRERKETGRNVSEHRKERDWNTGKKGKRLEHQEERKMVET
jgi:hypothetical protein